MKVKFKRSVKMGLTLTARTHRQHSYSAACGGMAVRTDKRFTGLSEALQMYLMAYAVAGPLCAS